MFGFNKIPDVYAIGSLILMIAVCRGTTIVANGHMAVAVVAGSRSTTLTCSSSVTTVPHAFSWAGPNGQYIVYTGLPGSPCSLYSGVDRNQYTVSAPSNGSYCNLIILNATTYQAGSYTCGDGAQVPATANLIVLNSGPNCSTDAVHGTVVYPGQVTMRCSVQYNPFSGWIPSLQWNTTNLTSSATSGNIAYSTLTYNTGASTPMPSIPSYSCSVGYNSSVSVGIIQPCSTNPVTVFWCPISVNISGAPDDSIASGSNLTCSASGNPSPTYQWFNSTNNLLTNGPLLTVWNPDNPDNYTCNASNNANGNLCSMSATQIIIGPDPGSTKSNDIALILGVVLGVGVPVIILIIFVYCKLVTKGTTKTATASVCVCA